MSPHAESWRLIRMIPTRSSGARLRARYGWLTIEAMFHLRQSHENGQLVDDSMFGTLIGTQIRVTDEDQGRMVELVLNRE